MSGCKGLKNMPISFRAPLTCGRRAPDNSVSSNKRLWNKLSRQKADSRACVQVTQAYRTSQHPRQSASLRQSFLKFFCINCAHILLTLLSWTLNDFDFSIEWNKKLEPSWILRRSVVTTMSSKLGLTRGRCNREKYRNIKSEWERWRRKTDLNDRKEKEKLWNWS